MRFILWQKFIVDIHNGNVIFLRLYIEFSVIISFNIFFIFRLLQWYLHEFPLKNLKEIMARFYNENFEKSYKLGMRLMSESTIRHSIVILKIELNLFAIRFFSWNWLNLLYCFQFPLEEF